jgi:hypothetical protein
MEGVRGAIAVLAVSLAVGACGPAKDGSGRSTGPAEQRSTVVVNNQNWADVRVYLVAGQQRIRLGSVPSMRTELFRVPISYARNGGTVRLMVQPMASNQVYTTEALQLGFGQQANLTVNNHLAVSNVSIRSRW